MPCADAYPKDGRTNRHNDGVVSSLSDVFMTIGNPTSFLRAGRLEGVNFRVSSFALPHLGHHFLALLGSEFGILRFTAAPAERDCRFIFHW
jgi:hypothetical protein